MGVENYYHIFTKSIAGYKIFVKERDYRRMQEIIWYYRYERMKRFSKADDFTKEICGDKLVKIVSYCIMPTHLHFIIGEEKKEGISKFMANILNSYTRYFNLLHNRKGPLWESRFKKVLVETDDQLLHLTRYIHLNPTTARLIEKPEDWRFSSYREFLNFDTYLKICEFDDLVDIDEKQYKKFVEDNIDYQRQLHKIKKLIELEER
ncbi:MAG: transposase [Candidatus Omnitrophica bacterium]|nr:transposase [Candidatus Omnitrophota bacterium]MCM8802697.1 transposase [Candidatus Omnitrophota bacterium]